MVRTTRPEGSRPPSSTAPRQLALLLGVGLSLGIGFAAGGLLSAQPLVPSAPHTWSAALVDPLTVVSLLVLGLFIAFVILGLRALFTGGHDPLQTRAWTGIALIILTAVIILYVLIALASRSGALQTPRDVCAPSSPFGPPPPGCTTSGGGNNSSTPTGTGNGSRNTNGTAPLLPGGPSPTLPLLVVLPVAVALVVLVPLLFAAVSRGKKGEPEWDTSLSPGDGVREHLEGALGDLQKGDVRSARAQILEAYRSLLESATERDARVEARTPREVEEDLASRWHLSRPALKSLRTLFEEARYSRHEMTESQAAAASRSLEAVLEEWKAAPPTASRPARGAASPGGPP